MSEKKDYTIHLKAFDGPMELLLHLIEKNKIDIYDIPMAELTRQYLDYLDAMRELDMEVTSSFLVMAATLLQIKSRMMLPKKPKNEEGEEEDPRQELVERLLEYRRFKEVSTVLGSMADMQEHFVSRAPLPLPVHHLPPGNLDLKVLVAAFREVMESREENPAAPAAVVEPEPYHIEDKMEEILQKLRAGKGKLRFDEVFCSGTRSELIVTFLALLELIKQRSVAAKQQQLFGAIVIVMQ
ncbi:segregation and condensation protein A [Mitsuokella sp. WILCCON 0060]|uniref:segregation and condensation protein A n=1 Tax=Mitsuokella sp. WILCCON 0060 TaxID=3345341 RepID=UPI003F1DD042